MSVDVPIPGLRLVSEANAHTHWRVRSHRAKSQRNVVALVLRGTVAKQMMTMAPLTVIITRYAPSRGLDSDNLAGSAKHVRDQVAEELGVDDRDARVDWVVRQEKGPWGIAIRIEVSGQQDKSSEYAIGCQGPSASQPQPLSPSRARPKTVPVARSRR